MTYNTLTISANDTNFQKIVSASEGVGAGYYYNNDPNVIIYLTSKTQGNPVTVDAAPLLPLSGISLDGTEDTWAFVLSGQAILTVYPSGTSLTIATPTVQSLTQLSGTINVPANGSNTPVSLVDVSQYESYDLTMEVQDAAQGTAGHALTYSVTVQFFDDLTSGIPVYQEIWHPWVTTVNNTRVIASGPMHGHYMSIIVGNPSANGALTVNSLNLFGSVRNQQLSDWRQSHGNHVSDNTLTEVPIFGSGFENSLADTGFVTLSASTNYIIPLFLYAGPVMWYWQSGAAITFSGSGIFDIGTPGYTSGNINGVGGKLTDLNVATGTEKGGSLILPRCACAAIINVSGTGGQFAFKVAAQQGP